MSIFNVFLVVLLPFDLAFAGSFLGLVLAYQVRELLTIGYLPDGRVL